MTHELYGPWRGRWRSTPEQLQDHDLTLVSAETTEASKMIRVALTHQFGDDPAPQGAEVIGFCEVCSALIASRTDIVDDAASPLGKRSERAYWHASHEAGRWTWHGPLPTYADLVQAVGDHEHNDDLGRGEVRYYIIYPTGPFKAERRGTWSEVIEDIPLGALDVAQPPTAAEMNAMLEAGLIDTGMSGGIEFPKHRFGEAEWADIYSQMLEIGRFTEEPLPANLSGRKLLGWHQAHVNTFREGQKRRGR